MRRHSFVSACVAAAVLWLPVQARSAIVAGPFVSPINQHTYYLTDVVSWPVAEAQAVSLGGHLATIRNAAENQWLLTTFAPLTPQVGVHIGLNDIQQEGVWVWSSGEPVNYLNWGPGEPNNFGNEDWGELFVRDYNALHAGQWNDGQVFDSGIVEVVPEPATASFMMFGMCSVLGMTTRRRAAEAH